MRLLYIYDPDKSQVAERRYVTGFTDEQIAILKIHMIFRCHFPLELLDSEIEGMPPEFNQPISANIPRNRL